MCPSVIFSNVTPEQWLNMEERLKAINVSVGTADTGEIHIHSSDLEWTYAPGAQTLTIQVLNKPWLISCSEINALIQSEFKANT